MIEVELRTNLASKLDCPVVLEQSPNMPSRFVLMMKTGSSKTDKLNSAIFAFQSYGKTAYEASLLNEKVKEAVEELIQLNIVSQVKLNSDYTFHDTETKRYRYQAVFDIHHY